ncbi:lysozyme inhibitor LprI family protein [Hydrogenophaga sp. 5NK40-0174]|uniref:lysozyme inhibitor LprI family protein n=1 Tax=Hydrogenophaga sp. 5NK40-0174 TaxID=3127649 RepID=UPI00310B17DD
MTAMQDMTPTRAASSLRKTASRASASLRMGGVVLALGVLGGCVSLPGMQANVAPAEPTKGLEPQKVNVASDAVTYHFDFVFGDGAGTASSKHFGAGFIVVTQDGKEVQAIAHNFELPRSALDRQGWMQFGDLNNDGWQDFMVPHRMTNGVTVMSLYEYDSKAERFAPVGKLSGLGEISRAAPGCVQVTRALTAEGAADRQNFCYSKQTGQWVAQIAPLSADDVLDADAGCAGATPDAKACRKSRMALEKTLKGELQTYGKSYQGVLTESKNKQYAARFVRNTNVEHRAWLRYRDARCNAYVREQGFDRKLFDSAIEACRYDLSVAQLHEYRLRNARLAETMAADDAGEEATAKPAAEAAPEAAAATAAEPADADKAVAKQ